VIQNKINITPTVYSDQVKTMKVKKGSADWGTQLIHIEKSDFPPTITIIDQSYVAIKINKIDSTSYYITVTPNDTFNSLPYGLLFLVNTFKKIPPTNEIPTIYDATRTLIHVVNAMNYTYPNNKATNVSM